MSADISPLASPDALLAEVDELAGLLTDVVGGGASLGFVEPFGHDDAVAWWASQAAELAAGRLLVWVARGSGRVVGTIGLAPVHKPNGRHRAEIVKLMVRGDARGRGIARALLAMAERAAARAGLTLLLLDTETGSPAERLYRGAGWTRHGEIPGFATDPAGDLRSTTLFHKVIGPVRDAGGTAAPGSAPPRPGTAGERSRPSPPRSSRS
ncbi:GNAT family N-acetyltransferase [Streptomyces litchfieldiae]|uniref:GNAT family N-acetyltransferase n=1 Tax=Streptomyces litchfieldiae TaxID=3075543 RepID=A0ABU2MNY1_9ACTN|nr:GNAT family N-acetyltransferase [Streptomyces sp. DSM 44938]MDT0342623.1 GNAT family N-acetyltransferase [Streptomyces sp. DSM 44938]